MGLIEKVLVPGERVRSWITAGGMRIAVTGRGLLVEREGRVTSVPLRHVHAVSVGWALGYLVAGVLLLLLAPGLGALGEELGLDGGGVTFLAFLAGLALAVYGYLNRYVLAIHYSTGSVSVRGGGSLVEAARRLREAVSSEG